MLTAGFAFHHPLETYRMASGMFEPMMTMRSDFDRSGW
jgi:hypothetical protein